MLDQSLDPPKPREVPLQTPSWQGRLRFAFVHFGADILGRLLGAAEGRTVGSMAVRELSLIIRSREWYRFLASWNCVAAGLLLIPLLWRGYTDHWLVPSNVGWMTFCGYALQVWAFVGMVNWTNGRLRRDLYSNRLDELMLTRCSPSDISMGEALASAIASLWVIVSAFPVCLCLSAIGGRGWGSAAELCLSLAPSAGLGVWFGMGWGLAFTLRRSAAIVPLSQWWFLGPFIPVVVAWSALGCLPLVWGLLSLVPGGNVALGFGVHVLERLAWQILLHWNPLLTVCGATGISRTTWFTDWLALVFFLLFMMRKSMDAVQLALSTLPERQEAHGEKDHWFHHDGHFLEDYGERKRQVPAYRDTGNPVAAFDAALGHRVYLHPFLWTLAVGVYLCCLGWSLLLPKLGLISTVSSLVAVLLPATGALLLMSGGVAVSFGWERDQGRWGELATLPISNIRLAMGKIKGVVRPTLWVGLTGSATALLLGWRGALPLESSHWMALHVLIFPVALACVSAVLALTTPSLPEALSRWAIFGAIPTLATMLPNPIGGEAGLALPFTPPLLVLLIVLEGPTRDLVNGAWLSLGLEVFGTAFSLLILHLFLRRWTTGGESM